MTGKQKDLEIWRFVGKKLLESLNSRNIQVMQPELIYFVILVTLFFHVVNTTLIVMLRNKHAKLIHKGNKYFGVHGEPPSVLKRLKISIKHLIKFNVLTSAFLSIFSSFRFLSIVLNLNILKILAF